MALQFEFRADEKSFNWVFPMLPEDPAGVQERNKLRPLAAPVESPDEGREGKSRNLATFEEILNLARRRIAQDKTQRRAGAESL